MIKKFICSYLLFVCIVNISNAQDSNQTFPINKVIPLSSETDSLSYCLGVYFAKEIRSNDVENINSNVIKMAIDQVFMNDSLIINDQQRLEYIKLCFQKLKTAINDKDLKEGQEYLKKNKNKPGVITMPNGLQYEIVKKGTGHSPDSLDVVKVNFKAYSINGELLASSQKNDPATIVVKDMLKGIAQALLMMNKGSIWNVSIPPELINIRPSKLKQNSVMIIELELVSIKKGSYRH